MKKVSLEFILCGVLLQQAQTGYELQRFMETTGRFMRSNTSMTQVYRSLRKMESEGWLTHEVEPRSGAQDAKRYRLTPDGRIVFFEWLDQPHQPTEFPGEPAGFFTKLRFRTQYRGREAAIELLNVEIDYRQQQIKRNRHRDRTEWYDADAPIELDLTASIIEWEHRRGTARMDSHLDACIELRDRLVAGEPACDDPPDLLQPADRASHADTTNGEDR
jgi:DNA-binding PadR family transcriptional regulator